MNLRLERCSHQAALYACRNWHYSKNVSVGKNFYLGVYEDGQFIGAIVFGVGVRGVRAWGRRFGLGEFDIAELTRVALREHKTPVSKLVRIAIGMVKKAMPGLKLLISYADLTMATPGRSIRPATGFMWGGQRLLSSMWTRMEWLTITG